MGDWVYYATVMSASDIVTYIEFAEQVCPNKDLDLMIQREVGARSEQIAEYLRTNEQRFFGSLIVAAYDGKPRFLPIALEGADFMSYPEGNVGILHFDGTEQYYAVDGQHRLAALKTEMERDKTRYEKDQISVIVICHAKDAEGMARARRLFTTVNRYAKKTARTTDIVMDEDDGIALVTRRLIREHPLFERRIKVLTQARNGARKLATGDAMQIPSDNEYLMAIGTFYKCNKALLPDNLSEEFSRKQQVPQYESLEAAFENIKRKWDELIEVVEPWKSLLEVGANVHQLRTSGGGNVLVRPVGITSFVRAVASGLAEGVSMVDVKAVAHRYHNLESDPWKGILVNTVTRRMNASRESEKLAQRLWRYLLGLNEDRSALQQAWKSHVDPQNERTRLRLPAPVR
jgi:DNA sulfur modification protein DndB